MNHTPHPEHGPAPWNWTPAMIRDYEEGYADGFFARTPRKEPPTSEYEEGVRLGRRERLSWPAGEREDSA